MSDDLHTLTFPFEAGALVRKQALYEMNAAALRMGLDFHHAEDGGWFESVFTISVRGTWDNINRYRRWVKAFGEINQ